MSHDWEDDEAYELRLARRQWLSPERKEKNMGKLKQMLLDYSYMKPDQIFTVIRQCNLLGFGEADYAALEEYLGPPAIGEDGLLPDAVVEYDHAGNKWDTFHKDPQRAMRFHVLRPMNATLEHANISCAWGVMWEDRQGVVIHDLNPSTDRFEDCKYWHVTGTREGWQRLNDGFVLDPFVVSLIGVS